MPIAIRTPAVRNPSSRLGSAQETQPRCERPKKNARPSCHPDVELLRIVSSPSIAPAGSDQNQDRQNPTRVRPGWRRRLPAPAESAEDSSRSASANQAQKARCEKAHPEPAEASSKADEENDARRADRYCERANDLATRHAQENLSGHRPRVR